MADMFSQEALKHVMFEIHVNYLENKALVGRFYLNIKYFIASSYSPGEQ